jgi:hypothetical protein
MTDTITVAKMLKRNAVVNDCGLVKYAKRDRRPPKADHPEICSIQYNLTEPLTKQIYNPFSFYKSLFLQTASY